MLALQRAAVPPSPCDPLHHRYRPVRIQRTGRCSRARIAYRAIARESMRGARPFYWSKSLGTTKQLLRQTLCFAHEARQLKEGEAVAND
jgi:hypothetical protein